MKYSIRSIAKVKSICLGTILRICAIHYPICQAYLTINIPIFFHYDSRSTVIDHSSQKNYRYIAYKINQCRCLTYISIRKFQLEGLSNTIHFQLLPNARSIGNKISGKCIQVNLWYILYLLREKCIYNYFYYRIKLLR